LQEKLKVYEKILNHSMYSEESAIVAKSAFFIQGLTMKFIRAFSGSPSQSNVGRPLQI